MISDHDNIVTGKEIEFLKLVLNPSPRVARELGWKSYYKYALLVHDGPKILVPPPKTILREYKYRNTNIEI